MTAKGIQTRADLLREKRETQPRKRKSESKRRSQTLTSGGSPPVLVRGGAAASLSHSRTKDKLNRRRFDIALNGQGAEMRLPSIPAVGLGWRLVSAVLIGALGFLIYFLWSSPFFNVEAIDVTGLVRLSNDEINAVADVVGKSIIFVDPMKVEQELRVAFPELDNISVETEVPNKVLVNLVERQLVLAWQQADQTYWIDENGMAYLPHGDGNPAITVQGSDLIVPPTVESEALEDGKVPVQTLPVGLVDSILTLSQQLPENSPITYDNQHGLGWFDPRGWQVYFGSGGEDMEIKWKVYWKTFKRLKKAGIRPAFISVEHVHAPYYRLER
ncbi:MAG: FtsQ-type POTRA domain-containing protein [Anaerolineales bacterium]|nr:FtsQ-type POTRA domain-containing protein [Anaerolineales bacterium]